MDIAMQVSISTFRRSEREDSSRTEAVVLHGALAPQAAKLGQR
jgi:hypothetical protein